MHKRFPAPITFLFVCFFLLGCAKGVEAKSISASVHDARDLYYESTAEMWSGLYVQGLDGPTDISVLYHGNVYDDTTGLLVADGSAVSVGTRLRFEQTLGSISYVTTGTAWDTPFGRWSPGAGFPDGPAFVVYVDRYATRHAQCSGEYYVNNGSGIYASTRVYIPFSVNPSTMTVFRDAESREKLSCVGNVCTVLSPGAISTNFNFSSTYGKFYYEYDNLPGFPGCHTSWGLGAMRWNLRLSGRPPVGSGGTVAVIPFPEQTITFNLTAVGGNAAPAAPVITPQPFTGPTSIAHTFSAQASDPEGDQIRYAFDWDNNGSVDAYIPPIGYVASNTLQSTQNPISGQWTLPGTASFKVRTEDNQGGISPWTGATATLFPVVNGLCGPASGIATSTSPTIGLCTSGTATAVSGSGPFTWGCLGSQGGTNDLSCSAPYVAPPTLKICENACDSTLDRTGQTFAMNQSSTKTLKACFNTAVSCTDPTGDMTTTATWTEANIPQNVITLSNGTLTSALATGQENFQVSYGGSTKTATVQVACVPLTCLAAKAQTDAYCSDTIQDTGVSNGCGSTLVCPGTRFCDTNYREVAP